MIDYETVTLNAYEDATSTWAHLVSCYRCWREFDLREGVEVDDSCYCSVECALEMEVVND